MVWFEKAQLPERMPLRLMHQESESDGWDDILQQNLSTDEEKLYNDYNVDYK